MAESPVPFLGVPVDEVMTPDPRTIEPEAPLSDAAQVFVEGGFRHLPVVDGAGRLVGMLSERDLRVKLGTDPENFPNATLEALSQPVSSAMTPDPISIGPEAKLSSALEIFADERVGALPVVGEGDELLGILSYVDVLAFLNRKLAQKGGASDLPPRSEAPAEPPARRPPSRRPKKAPRRRGRKSTREARARPAPKRRKVSHRTVR